MSLQLIFVVETNKTCKSDWIYIKDTIDYFFEKVRQYCAEQKYDFVWFCKDIERVYTGKK